MAFTALSRSVSIGICLAITVLGNASADDAAALKVRMHQVAENSNIDDPALKPWHLKMSVQLYDAKGRPTDTGMIEEWWAGRQKQRIVYTSPSYSATEVINDKGTFRTPGTGTAPYLYARLRTEVIHPMPDGSEIDQALPDLRKETMSKVPMDCIMLDEPIKNVAYPPLGLFPTYCVERDKDTLRIGYEFGTETVVRNRIGVFQGRHVPTSPSISIAGVLAASAHVEALGGIPESEGRFDETDGLEQAGRGAARIAGGVIAGSIVNKVAPYYPPEAKARHATGTVQMHALIGTDGHIHALRLISVPDPDLAIAAIAAVRQWIYKPYLLNGVPTEVDTTIAVNFNMN